MNCHLEILEIFYKFKNLHFIKIIPENLTHGECFAIMKLRKLEKNNEYKKITFSDLAKALDVSSPSLSRIVKHLEEKRYIVRIEDNIDRRNNFLELTKSGNDIANRVEKHMEQYCQKIYKRLGEKRFNNFINCLNDLYDISLEEIENKELKK